MTSPPPPPSPLFSHLARLAPPQVIHIFKDSNAKAAFDIMFDATAGMFKDLTEKGGVILPLRSQSLGPMWAPVEPSMSLAA